MADENDNQAGEENLEGQEQAEEQGGGEQPDPMRNLKAEMDRKLGNQYQDLNSKLEAILATMNQSTQQGPKDELDVESLKAKIYDDPAAVIREMEARTERKAAQIANEAISRVTSQASASQAAVNEVAAKYPEFLTPGSEAARRATEISKLQPQGLQGTAAGVKLAMMEAASELGLVPASARQRSQQRSSSSDDFSLGQGGNRSQGGKRKEDPKKDIPETTLLWSELLGRDTKDPKVLEGLKKATQRKYNRYS